MEYIIIPCIFAVISIILALYFYFKYNKIVVLIQDTKTSKITTLKQGFAEITGKIEKKDGLLTSPMSRKPCVYYRFKVEEKRSSGKNSHWKRIIDDEKYVRFFISDNSGKAIVDCYKAKFNFDTDVKGNSGTFKDATPEMVEALNKYGYSDEGMFGFNKTLRYKEIFLEEGDNAYLLGEVTQMEGYFPVFSKASSPFYIADKPEEQIVKQYQKYKTIALICMAAVLLGVGLFLYYQLGSPL